MPAVSGGYSEYKLKALYKLSTICLIWGKLYHAKIENIPVINTAFSEKVMKVYPH